eukprot:1892944-Amphidinium_carterae.1
MAHKAEKSSFVVGVLGMALLFEVGPPTEKADTAALQCINGHWFVEGELPECHRDCAPYQLPEGYEINGISPGPAVEKGGSPFVCTKR